jgi:SAM-dependent methyltransferase
MMDWDQRYESEDTPWNIGRHDSNLVDFIEKRKIQKCSVLEIGCGFGYSSIWMAKNGFTVTGIDIAKLAVEKAKKNAQSENVKCDFFQADFLNDTIEGRFDFAFDRGCFHSTEPDGKREQFAKKVADYLVHGGLWLTQCGNHDDIPRELGGMPRLKAIDIVTPVEEFFEILLLESIYIDRNQTDDLLRGWLGLFKNRGIGA